MPTSLQRPTKRPLARFPQVRERADVVRALAREADKVGISANEALRQLIAGYLDNPTPMAPEEGGGPMAVVFGSFRASPEHVRRFRSLTRSQGVSVADALRHVVRRFLRERGHHV